MNKEEFLQGLQNALSGQVSPAIVRENLNYYHDYFQTEIGKGRSAAEVLEELGDPRLIARTIIDATPGAGNEAYETYDTQSGSGSSQYQEDRRQQSSGSNGGIHYYDLSKWYWKLLAVVMVVVVITVVITIVSGLLSLVIPMLPVIGLVILIMWFVRGPRR